MPDLLELVRRPLLVGSPLEQYADIPSRRSVAGDMVLTALGQPGADFNFVAVLGPESWDRVRFVAGDFFGGPFSVIVEVGQADDLESELGACGWEVDEEEPALVLTPVPEPPAPPPELDIRPVSSEADLDAFFSVSGTGRRWIPSMAAASDPRVALLVGWLAGRPVATSRISCLDEVGDITGVVIAPEFRRRGYGTAMTWAAIAAGLNRGCTAMTLTATEMGYPVYRRLGFVPVCRYRSYMPPSEENRD